MHFPRASGVLLHPTSLPGPFGIGDLGPSAYQFVDFLVAAGQTYWQVLPLGPTGYGDSPYQCFSAFAGNTNLINLAQLGDEGLLTDVDLADVTGFPPDRVDFGPVIECRNRILRKAFDRYRQIDGWHPAEVAEFYRNQREWLDDYALFRALKDSQGGAAWNRWAQPFARREADALAISKGELQDEIEANKFAQFLFFQHWFALKRYANDRGIRIVGDIPLFVAMDSVDVWTSPEQFKLNADHSPRVVAGVPPDYFSQTGQLWGNPIYEWDRMAADSFRWWVERLRWNLEIFDVLRLDHFRGFAACWEVPAGDETAVNGQWVSTPGKELFRTAKSVLGDMAIVAEDLGVITPDVEALRDELGFPGMRVMQFAFGSDAGNLHLPHNYVHNVVAYTGTHDNDTAVGWFEDRSITESDGPEPSLAREREFARRYLNSNGDEINWDLIRAVWASVADTAIAPLQDLLGSGHDARMNLPASESGNWSWRFEDGAIDAVSTKRLRELTETYGRLSSSNHEEHS